MIDPTANSWRGEQLNLLMAGLAALGFVSLEGSLSRWLCFGNPLRKGKFDRKKVDGEGSLGLT